MELREEISNALGEEQAAETPAETQAQPPVEGQAEETPQAPEFDWTKDGRFESMWQKDPNNLYKSYKQFEPLHQTMGQFGIKDADGLKEALEKYKEFSDPENPYTSTYNQLNTLMEHEKYGQKFKGFLEEIRLEAERDKFGQNLPPEVIAQLDKVNSLESKLGEFETEKQKELHKSEIDQNLSKIDEFAQQHGLEYDADRFLGHCAEKQVPYSMMMAAFKDYVFDDVINKTKVKEAETVTQNLHKNKQAELTNSQRTTPKTGESVSLKDKLTQVFN